MYMKDVKIGPCIAPTSGTETCILSTKLLDTSIEAAKLLQAWNLSSGGACVLSSRLVSFNGVSSSQALASPEHDSPQRAEWIDDDSSVCYTYFPAQRVYMPTLALPEGCQKLAYGLNGLINSLPDELLCHVFRFLPAPRDRSVCALVSKRWLLLQSHMCHDEFVCVHAESVDEAGDEVQSHEDILNDGQKASGNDKRVERQPQWAIGDLSRCLEGKKASDIRLAAVAVGTGARGGLGKLSIRQSVATDIGLSAIGSGCAAMKALCMWDCPNIKDEGLSRIGKGCGLLEKVDLFKCPLVGDLGLQSIAQNCPLLSFLSLDECGSISDKSLVAVGQGCSNLLSLNIRSCPLISDDGLVSAVCNLKRLKRMKLDGLRVGDKSLACIGSYAKALVCLSLANLDLVSERGFTLLSLAPGMQSLRRFSVTTCVNFTDSAFAVMGKMWHGLKHISLVDCNGVSDMGLSFFMQNAASLEVLQLEMCNSITGRGLISVFSNKHGKVREVQVKNCDGIQQVGVFPPSHLSNVSSVKSVSIKHCPGVDNMLLALIGCLCPDATDVDFSGLTGITDEGVLAFLYSGRRQLASVNLSRCMEIGDRVVCAIAEQCGESLRSLSLDRCKTVSDKGLKAVAQHCVVLEDLDVSQCRVTDEGVAAVLLEMGLTLSSLNVSGCSGITNKILPLIEDSCHGLSDLNLKHCQGLSQKAINGFESRLWKCAVLSV
eukprot:c22905_g1_i1 orf=256-2397(+)